MSAMAFGSRICLFLLMALASASAAQHPRTLSQVKKGLWAVGLTHQAGGALPRRSAAAVAYSGQKTTAVSLGQYTVAMVVNGETINAVIDTGSGTPQVACKGVQAERGYTVQAFNPATASPAVSAVSTSSAACQLFCNAGDGCSSQGSQQCTYKVTYGDTTFISARVYSGSMTFAGSSLASDAPFYFGCAYQASTNPYFFTDTSALFGFDWQPISVWSQMITAGLVSDTMYSCMGNGGDGKADQSGVIVLGTDGAVGLPANYATEVITITLMNPASNPSAMYPPSTWVRLTSLSIGANPDGSYSGSASLMASGNTPLYYLLDSGTSQLLLTPKEYKKWVTAFYTAVYDEPNETTADYTQESVTLTKYYTPAQLDKMLPPILFTFQGASGPVRIMPSNYMIWEGGAQYSVNVGSSGSAAMGILGNAWMNGWLIQQTRSTLKLKMTRVKSCNDIIY